MAVKFVCCFILNQSLFGAGGAYILSKAVTVTRVGNSDFIIEGLFSFGWSGGTRPEKTV